MELVHKLNVSFPLNQRILCLPTTTYQYGRVRRTYAPSEEPYSRWIASTGIQGSHLLQSIESERFRSTRNDVFESLAIRLRRYSYLRKPCVMCYLSTNECFSISLSCGQIGGWHAQYRCIVTLTGECNRWINHLWRYLDRKQCVNSNILSWFPTRIKWD